MQVILNTIAVDTDANTIGEGTNAVEIESQAMAVLSFLIANAGVLVTREMLQKEIWQGKVVTDNSLHRVIAILRKALGDNPINALFIKTIHSKGYILIAEITTPSSKHHKLTIAIIIALFFGLLFTFMTSWFEQTTTLSFQDLGNETSLMGLEYLPQLATDDTALIFVHQPNMSQPQSRLMLKKLNSQEQLSLIHI